MNDFDGFARDINVFAAQLAALPVTMTRQVRGITARHVDRIAAEAKQTALSTWTRYGQGEDGAAGTLRGRMSRDRSEVIGYVFADGQGAFQSEHGTSIHAPQPVISQTAAKHAGAWVNDLAELAADL